MSDSILEPILPFVQKPSRYLGTEINSIHKDPSKATLKVALAFPDLYDIGTSHFGLQILYHLLNARDDWMAERVFAPAIDMEQIMREKQVALLSLESRTPLAKFDIVGFSLLYELNYTNVVNMMDLAGIPLRREDRHNAHPFIIAGGPCVCNPEPMADFFDAMVFGDGESTMVQMAEAWVHWNASGAQDRDALLRQWAQLKGVYVPRFFKARYDRAGHQVLEPEENVNASVRRSVIQHFKTADFPDRPIIPFGKPIHDRLRLEVSRGCSRGCRFCQAGMIYRPVRERRPDDICTLIQKALANTGYEDISLLSLSTGDYTCLTPLMEALIQQCSQNHVAISLPSLRAGALTPRLMDLIQSIRKTGFTIAPEAGSQRLRDVINKNITYDDVEQTVRNAFELGWTVIKLYFMIGLPTETQEDLDAIVEMVKKLKKIKGPAKRKAQINVSVTTFIPKPHTPFQWCRQISLEASKAKIAYLKEKLRLPGVQFKWQHPEMSMVEGILSRGDRRVGQLIVHAWRNGARFDGWNDLFDLSAWRSAFRQSEIDPFRFTDRERDLNEPLPWGHLDCGVDRRYLSAQWKDAFEGKTVSDCRHGDCHGCGVCDFSEIKPVVFQNGPAVDAQTSTSPEAPVYTWIALMYRKTGQARFFGHLELSNIFSRAVRRAGVAVHYSQGYHPMPKISFDDPLPLGMESLGEFVRMRLIGAVDCRQVQRSINQHLPEGLEIVACMPRSEAKKVCSQSEHQYTVSLHGEPLVHARLEAYYAADTWPYTRTTRKGSIHRFNLKDVVMRLARGDDNTIHMHIKTDSGHTVRPIDVLAGVFDFTTEQLKHVRIIKQAPSIQKRRVDKAPSNR